MEIVLLTINRYSLEYVLEYSNEVRAFSYHTEIEWIIISELLFQHDPAYIPGGIMISYGYELKQKTTGKLKIR